MAKSEAAPQESKADVQPAEAPAEATVAAPPKKSLEDRAKGGEKLTLEELAKFTGNFIPEPPIGAAFGAQDPRRPFNWKHSAAAMLHGWNDHERATVEPLTLTLEDYQKALAAIDPPKGFHTPVPHKPACSKFTAHDPDKLAEAAKKHFDAKKGGN